MVKVNNKKRMLSDKVNSKKSDKKQGTNPFEVHINKQKHQILGQKLKNDRGLPGVSRAKAIKKRKHTLLQEYNLLNKSNKFVDKRIGEKNFNMTAEDKQMARFTAERIRSHNKKSIYNLADEEVLTHRGQTLSEIEKFDDPRSDDDDDDDELDGRKNSGKLDDGFVEDAHFGGGILKKTGPDGAKSHKDLIEQLIAESKKRKAEKQKIREQTIELTEKLDTEWKDLLPLVNKSKKDETTTDTKNVDDYDKVMRELRFEARGQPSDRLKSEEEIVKEERERLEKLEQDRLKRMRGIVDEIEPARKHRSADDLDDNFVIDDEPETTLAYNEDGTILMPFETLDEEKEATQDDEEEDEKEEDVEEGSAEEEESEDESEDDLSDLKHSESESSDEEEVPEKSNKKKRKLGEDIEVSAKKEKLDENIEVSPKKGKLEKDAIVADIIATSNQKTPQKNENKKETKTPQKENNNKSKEVKENGLSNDKTLENLTETKNKSLMEELLEKERLREAAAKELPYTFTLPKSYEELQNLLSKKSPEQQSIIIERMIKCNHPNLANENKLYLGNLFAYLLQHLNDVSSEPKCFSILISLLPQLFDLAHLNKVNAHVSMLEVMKEKHGDFNKKPKSYPGMDVLMFLQVISKLFPTSDFRHQVVTPTLVFVLQMLISSRVKNRYDITYGLFLVTVLLEYTSLSKRLVPAAINYLLGLLHMAVPKCGVQLLKITPPFKATNTHLVLSEKSSIKIKDRKMTTEDFNETKIDEEFKIRIIYNTVKMIEEFYENYDDLPSCDELFRPHVEFLEKLPEFYPEEVQTVINSVKDRIKEGMKNRRLELLKLPAKKPKALRLYEPNIVKIVEGKNHKIMSKEKAEKSKLLHKYKKEMKGALREIRRDKSFLGRVKLKQRIQSDRERKEKVNKIFAEASVQQSELNAMSRKKKNK